MPAQQAYVFEARLDGHRGVSRTIALAGDQTLELLHTLLRAGFGWDDDHLYSFWFDGQYWGDPATEYTSPVELEEAGDANSAATPLSELDLHLGQEIAYIFDFGDDTSLAQERRETGERHDGVQFRGTTPRRTDRRGRAAASACVSCASSPARRSPRRSAASSLKPAASRQLRIGWSTSNVLMICPLRCLDCQHDRGHA